MTIEDENLKVMKSYLTKADILAWRRREEKLQKLIEEKINPIEAQILELIDEKNSLLEEVVEVRRELVETCIHPDETLVALDENMFNCKFCNKTIKVL